MFRFVIAAAILSSAACLSAAEPAKVFQAGAAVVDISPPKLPVSMTGGFADRQATLVHDPLHARALVLDDGQTRLALVVCDSCLISRELFDIAKRRASTVTGIPANHMQMSATHTHSAVTVVEMANCKPDPVYNEFLTARIAEAVAKANDRLQPARIAWGVGSLPEEVNNRRWKMRPGTVPVTPLGVTSDQVKTNPGVGGADLIEPAGPTDPEVCVLAVQTADGKPLALWTSYALHYVGNTPRDALSADYFGEFARQTAEKLAADGADAQFVAMLANGASGDINNIDFRNAKPRQQPMEQIRIVADKVSNVAVETYRKLEFKPWVALRAIESEISLGVRQPSIDEVVKARATLAASDRSPANLVRDVYAQETLVLADWPDAMRLKLQVLRIGDLGIAAIPCEAFCQIGLDIKAASALRPTFVVGLANGYNGYLPTPEQHALGGYETWRCRWSYLETEASRKITAGLLELLQTAAQ